MDVEAGPALDGERYAVPSITVHWTHGHRRCSGLQMTWQREASPRPCDITGKFGQFGQNFEGDGKVA